MNYSLLDHVKSPEDLKKLSEAELPAYCAEARKFLLESVSKTGGHLASSLGVVELTVALHRAFDSPKDKIVWDVGHQSYVHKLITGRKDRFNTLRQEGGLSGFTRRSESEHDAFISGHSSTSISAAIGMAKASELKHEDNYTVAVIGDGAFTGGIAYEALNNALNLKKFIVVLNHNAMSISKNVGSLAKYLSLIRSKPGYLKFKNNISNILDKTPVIGKPLKKTLQGSKSIIKNAIYHSTFFEDLGFTYIGPIDGHNLNELSDAFTYAKASEQPVFMLVDTIKGKGYSYAEKNPGAYHGISKFNVENGNPDIASEDSFSTTAGQTLSRLADKNKKICAITAAMKYGTGLDYFCARHKDRFFDVGIAEAHAVTFAAGLSANGMIPVFAVYSTFLQRSFDQILHDCSIEKKHVVLLIDRAGIVGNDGETHQGLFDAAMLNIIPGASVYSPTGYSELEYFIKKAVLHDDGVAAVRYPRGSDKSVYLFTQREDGGYDDYYYLGDRDADALIITYGRLFNEAYNALNALAENKKHAALLKLNKIIPLPDEAVNTAAKYKKIYFFEEGMKNGGVAQTFESRLYSAGFTGSFDITAIDDKFIPQSTIERALELNGLDCKSMVKKILQGEK